MNNFLKFVAAIAALRLSRRGTGRYNCPRCHGFRSFLMGVAVGIFIGAVLWTAG